MLETRHKTRPDEAGRGPDVEAPRWVGWVGGLLPGPGWLVVYFWARADCLGQRVRGMPAAPLPWFWLRRVTTQCLAIFPASAVGFGLPLAVYLVVHIPTEIYKHSYRIAARKAGWTDRSLGPVFPKQVEQALAEGMDALNELRKEDPGAAERIIRAIDSGKASAADLAALVARARQDALSGEKGETRLGMGERLPPSETPPTDKT